MKGQKTDLKRHQHSSYQCYEKRTNLKKIYFINNDPAVNVLGDDTNTVERTSLATSPLQKIPLYGTGGLPAEYLYVAFLSHHPFF